jgi:hypothetical protein
MWTLVIAMLAVLVLAGLVVLYVAFPHRGEEIPAAGWLGDVMRKSVDSAPTLDNTAEEGADLPSEHLDLTGHRTAAPESSGRDA